ncbi:MAG: B12-binding domain-containing radical SAM protein [Promethearchaeota archaeon]|jgi:radical SAM superfamily enzyme YgiQ (UPF0313 family)
MIDVCLIKAPDSGIVYQNLSEFSAIEPPVWVAVMANYLRKRNYSVEILDAEAEHLTLEQTARRVSEIDARLTVFVIYGHQPSASTQRMPDAIATHHILKQISSTKTMFIGTHAAALPVETLNETRTDFVCTGEGPETVVDVVDALKAGDNGFDKIGSLCFCEEEGNIVTTGNLPLIQDLDAELPNAAWDLLPMEVYRAHNWHCFGHIDQRQPYASLYTSLGCPFKCSFCCINAPFGKAIIRYLSPEKVIDEIDILVNKYGVRNIKIPDEMFVLHKHHVIGICDLIIERGYDLNIWAYARIDTVQDRFLDKLRQAGFNWLALGIESGSDFVRDGALKQLKDDDIVNTVKKIQEHGINVCGNYIFGLPDDTFESMQSTLNLAKELNTEWANFYCAMAYPGSPLHKICKENGTKLPEDKGGPGWIGYSQHAYETFSLSSAHLINSEIIKFRDDAHHDFFESEKYLSMLEEKFGKPTRDHVVQMNRIRLRRKYEK